MTQIKDNSVQTLQIGEKAMVSLANKVTLTMSWCPPGEFTMGISETNATNIFETPAHQVILSKGFWIGCMLITQEQWLSLMDKSSIIYSEGINLPAEGMTWYQANIFCKILTERLRGNGSIANDHYFSLPSEVQWEYACRSNSETKWHFGNDQTHLDDYAWYQNNSDNKSHPVGLKLPNSLGLYDLYGNLSEWCQDDLYLYNKLETFTDPIVEHSDSILKIVRGGNYHSSSNVCHSAARNFLNVNNLYNDAVGFRVVCNIDTKPS